MNDRCGLYTFYIFESCDIKKLIKNLKELWLCMLNYNSHTVLAWNNDFSTNL